MNRWNVRVAKTSLHVAKTDVDVAKTDVDVDRSPMNTGIFRLKAKKCGSEGNLGNMRM